MHQIFSRLKTAVALAALTSLVFTSLAAAQTNEQMGTGSTQPASQQPATRPAPASNGPFVNRIQSPVSGTRVAGNVTFTGAAVDCGRGIAATRVAVYQGVDGGGTYLADAAMDTQRSLARYCSTQAGTERIGFTLITNTRNLRDGPITLAFVAEFPGVAPQITTTEIIVDNIGPRYRYDPYYNDGYNSGYGNYGNSGYGNYGYGGYNGYGYNYPRNGAYYSSCGGYNNYNYNYNGACGNTSSYPVYSGGYAGYYGGTYSGCYLYGTACVTGGGYNNYSYGAYPYYNNYNNYSNPYYNYYNYNPYNYNPYYGGSGGGYTGGCNNPLGGINCGAGYGYTNITLNQAGQTVRSTGPQILTGFANCSTGGVTTVTIYDRSTGNPILIGTSTGGNYGVSWTPGAPLGARTIQVVAQGACGTFSQSFSVIVIA